MFFLIRDIRGVGVWEWGQGQLSIRWTNSSSICARDINSKKEI